jgi:glycosyltransferase involved in cell wall biosynthesis
MKPLRSQEEMMASWTGDVGKPIVSICCITYNHETYIEDALESFLIQETDFPIEILIHDDASTDSTASIIRNYEQKYPRIIKTIYQTQNQYSIGNRIGFTLNFERACGKYIALCEGDDCWTDKNKLQRQVDILLSDPSISITYHCARKIDYLKGTEDIICRYKTSNTYVKRKDVIHGGGAFMPTASIMFRGDIVPDIIKFFYIARPPVGDIFIQFISSYNGKIYYIDQPMSIYRFCQDGSWTKDNLVQKKQIEHGKRMLKIIDKLTCFLSGKKKLHFLSYPYLSYKIAETSNQSPFYRIKNILLFNKRGKNLFFLISYYMNIPQKIGQQIKDKNK